MNNKGNLIYIPAETVLYKFSKSKTAYATPNGYLRTSEPINALVVDDEKVDGKFLKILHNGESWFVHEKETRKCYD